MVGWCTEPEYPLRVEGTMIRLLLLAFLSMLVLKGVVFAESGPVFSDTGPDAEAYGAHHSKTSDAFGFAACGR